MNLLPSKAGKSKCSHLPSSTFYCSTCLAIPGLSGPSPDCSPAYIPLTTTKPFRAIGKPIQMLATDTANNLLIQCLHRVITCPRTFQVSLMGNQLAQKLVGIVIAKCLLYLDSSKNMVQHWVKFRPC